MVVVEFLFFPFQTFSQEDKKVVPDGTEGTVLIVPEKDSTTGKTKNLPPNEFDLGFSTLKFGLGTIAEYATYVQDKVYKQQMDSANLETKGKYKTRDFRLLLSGRFNTKRLITWKFAYMYDGDKDSWFVRESGFIIGVPELKGNFFIGRTKEGYSTVKVMIGYAPWVPERQMGLDVIPILADGIKYFGYLPKPRIFLNFGYYNDVLSKGEGFSTYEWQYDARVGWLPFYDKEKNRVFHFGINYRYGKPLDGKITVKSRPESNPAPFIINTGSFTAENSYHYGAELFYSTGRMLIGSEVIFQQFNSNLGDDHKYFGGDIAFTYLFTDTKRPYNTSGNVFGFIPVRKSVFKGGWGEWEGVVRFSSLDLTDGSIKGGSFWRITPMVNWYMSKSLRMEFIYGYGILDRYDLKGALQIYQVRLQLGIL